MRRKVHTAALACAASSVFLASSNVLANVGTQLPLSQIQAGSEVVDNSLVVNGGFEQPGVAGPNATGWNREGEMFVGTPINPPTPASVLGSFSAHGNADFSKYTQTVTLQPNTDYVISAYIWNFGVPGPPPHNDLNPGDLAVVELVDPKNLGNTAGVILEPIARDNGDASQGYFLYETFNSSQFANGIAVLEVEMDVHGNPGVPRPPIISQFDNVAITPLAMFQPPQMLPTGSTWNVNSGGLWSNAANWQGGVPDGIGAVANFGPIITSNVAVIVDSNRTVGTVNFQSAQSYTLNGIGSLTLDAASGSAGLNVNAAGSHEIMVPMQLNDNTVVSVANGGALRLSGQVTAAAGVGISKAGSGLLEMRNVRAASLNVQAGTVRVLADGTAAGTSNVQSLSLDPNGTLDLTDNALVVDYNGASPLPAIRAAISSAYNAGAWDQPGLSSSLANNSTHGVGYAEAAGISPVPAIFGTVDATAVLARYTRYGDANLDGIVNLADFNRLAANFGSTSAGWDQGDFNYDGLVNLADFNRLAANFGLQAGSDGPTPDDWSALMAAVPEPTSLMLAGLGALALVRRQRKV